MPGSKNKLRLFGSFTGYFSVTFFSVFLAILLTTSPIPAILIWFWPQWFLVMVIYLVFTRPHLYGVYFGFMIGLIDDVLIGNHLGLHALTFTGICYFLIKMNQRIAFFPTIQQFLIMFALILIDCFAIAILNSHQWSYAFLGHATLSALTTIGCLYLLMSFFGSRSHILKLV
jgi:rod shape-determining protein MreD